MIKQDIIFKSLKYILGLVLWLCHYLRAKFKLSGTVRKRYSTSEFHPNILLKSREITLPIKVCIVKAMVFPVVMCFCELDQKKAEHHRIYAFELWCWRRLLNVPWTARRSNQSILGESDSEYSLEGLMLKLKPVFAQCDAHRWLIGKVPDAGKDRGQKEKKESEDEMRWHHPCNENELEQTPEDSEGQGGLVCYSPWGHDLAAEQQQQKFNSSVTLTTVHVLKTAIHG